MKKGHRFSKTNAYIDCLSDFQWFSLPAVDEQIGHSFIVDLHVRHSEKELLLWTLWAEKCHWLD